MQINEIIAEMQKLGIKPVDLCNDLGFNKGDLSSYLSEKKPLPNSRAKALKWYFKYKTLNIEEKMKLKITSTQSIVIINQNAIFQVKINNDHVVMYYNGGTILFKFKNTSDFYLFSDNILESSMIIKTEFIYTTDPKDKFYDVECSSVEII